MAGPIRTVYAKCSGAGVAAISVVRISGPNALKTLKKFLRNQEDIIPRTAVLKTLWWHKKRIDKALIIYFEKDRSFTGEETIEVQMHGGAAIVEAFLKALSSIKTVKAAGAGDFTRQALENGKMDLSQVEGLANLINAETEGQKIQAEKLFYGEFSKTIQSWRFKLLKIKANLEAAIDFSEDDIEINLQSDVCEVLSSLTLDMSKEVRGSFYAEKLTKGFEIAIIGSPNVGKSTLLNYLVGNNVSIVSDIPGTTRDIIEKRLMIDGFLVSFYDCAGIRESDDPIEKIGIEKAQECAHRSDLRVFLVEDAYNVDNISINKRSNDIIAMCKVDVKKKIKGILGVSGITGAGIDELMVLIKSELNNYFSKSGSACNTRQRNAIISAIQCMKEAKINLSRGDQFFEFVLEDIRQGVIFLDQLLGKIDIEDVYAEIFTKFCIGK